MKIRLQIPAACLLLSFGVAQAPQPKTNSIGMQLVDVPAGAFTMGHRTPALDQWDEAPAHRVKIARGFAIGVSEVTAAQFRQFRPDFEADPAHAPFATGVSWHDAVAFCRWLTEKEGRPYRLPTEAEWEYACRAGTDTPFWSGARKPRGEQHPWGLVNLHSGPAEWCADWYGPYDPAPQTDPIGPAAGLVRVVRGGGLDADDDAYARSRNRAGMPPGFGSMRERRDPAAAVAEQPGLVGQWFASNHLTRPQASEVLTELEQDWTGQGARGSDWSARWVGTLVAPRDGNATFRLTVDDVGVLELDGKELVKVDGGGAATAAVPLREGQRHPVRLTLRQRSKTPARLHLQWSFDGGALQTVPAEVLRHSAAQAAAMVGEWPGRHAIGFRVVQAPPPASAPTPEVVPFVRQCVRAPRPFVTQGPDPTVPWYRKRPLLPVPPDNVRDRAAIRAAGLPPALMGHNHCPALAVCPNGDLLAVLYTSEREYEPEVSLIACRLRFGAEQWDMPEVLVDFADANDHAPLLWRDGEVLHLFWGSPRLPGGYPFQQITSADSGATWSEVRLPQFVGAIGPHARQPITSAFRLGRTTFVASDGDGGTSLLWASDDAGATWRDPGGRSAGRHTAFVPLRDGRILGLGGKNTEIDGFMPQAHSADGGRTWTVSRSRFPALGANQRPTVIRLASGRLFAAFDLQHFDGRQPPGIDGHGAAVALSDDDGTSWQVKVLSGAQAHESPRHPHATLGYAVARQARNGVIHLLTTMNDPCLHFELNEAWILSEQVALAVAADVPVEDVRTVEEHYANGELRHRARFGRAADGRVLLHGMQEAFHPGGKPQWRAVYRAGRALESTLWRRDGGMIEEWRPAHDGARTWVHFDAEGGVSASSTWKDGRRADG